MLLMLVCSVFKFLPVKIDSFRMSQLDDLVMVSDDAASSTSLSVDFTSRSAVWTHFRVDKDAKQFECQLCLANKRKPFKYTGPGPSATVAKNHLQKFHKKEYDEVTAAPKATSSAGHKRKASDKAGGVQPKLSFAKARLVHPIPGCELN